MLRFLTAGESHGPTLVGILEGMPAGLNLPEDAIDHDLRRRQGGHGRGGRQRIERDHVDFLGGLAGDVTTGGPIAMRIENRDWERQRKREQPVLTVPRPGHADLAGAAKYRLDDMRVVLERASARETAMRVAIGSVAKCLLREFGIVVAARVLEIGGVVADDADLSREDVRRRVEESAVYVADAHVEAAMVAAI
ncbi:MAG TPA: chorismate synthase, partial [Chloroflexota bacterium]|nr:chorismate synthase [Chloroflexota bacterium]